MKFPAVRFVHSLSLLLLLSRDAQGLEIQVPDTPPCKYAFSIRILPG